MDTNRRRRTSRVLQCEGLETRQLLSGIAPPAAEVRTTLAHQLLSQGVIQGGVRLEYNSGLPVGIDKRFSMAGKGCLSHLGQIAFSAQYRGSNYHPGPLSYSGELTIRKGQANEIGFSFRGDDSQIRSYRVIANWHGQVNHSSGIYAGASGTMTALVVFNPGAGRFVLRIRIKLDRA